MLYNEPTHFWKEWVRDPNILEHFDFVMHTDRSASTLPITTICNWGRDIKEYLEDKKDKKIEGRDIIYFCDHGIAREYSGFLDEFRQIIAEEGKIGLVDQSQASKVADKGVYHIPWRLEYMSTFKFALVTEAS